LTVRTDTVSVVKMGAAQVTFLVLAALLGAGCRQDVEFVTPLVAALPGGSLPNLGEACGASDFFRFDLFEFTAESGDGSPSLFQTRCGDCAGKDCPLLYTECRCSGDRVDAETAAEALSGLRIEGLEPDVPLCARVLTYNRPVNDGPTDGAAPACDCSLGASLPATLCALSEVGAVNESRTPIVVREFHCHGAALFGAWDERRCAEALTDCEQLCRGEPECEQGTARCIEYDDHCGFHNCERL
jgi:hypothetical protein